MGIVSGLETVAMAGTEVGRAGCRMNSCRHRKSVSRGEHLLLPNPVKLMLIVFTNMNIKHITSDSLRHLLSLTDKKEQLIKGIQEVENEIAKTLKGAATTVVQVAEAVVPVKSAKKKGRRKTKSKSGKRGGLKTRVLALLEAAGHQGLRVKEIAEKLGTTPGNISVWFSTTGKKLTSKIEPGRYAVKGSVSPKSAKVKKGAPAKAKKASKPAKKKIRLSKRK